MTHSAISGCHYIAGEHKPGQGRPFSSHNPMDGRIIWKGKKALPAEITQVISEAHKAGPTWANLDFKTRAQAMLAFASAVERQKLALAELISQESGKPLWESQGEVTAVIAKVNLSIQAFEARCAEQTIPTADATGRLRFKPHGVMLVLGPFNFPAHLSNGHIVPALLAGNTVIYKPSELTPAVAQFIMNCWHEAGLAKGVIQCVQGDAQVAKMLLDQDIQGVLFTGSYRAGLEINRHMSKRPEVILALEMGGNNPLVIGEIEQIDTAVYHSITSAFITAGQRCACARRIFIPQTRQGNRFLARLIEVSSRIKIGDFKQDPEPFMGPVIRGSHAKQHLLAQEHLIALGGKPLLKMSAQQDLEALLSPGLIDMSQVGLAPDEEIFAPLLQVYRYKDFNEAIQGANKTRYGLVAGLLSESDAQYRAFYTAMRAGIINWNRPTTGASSALPFGGLGHSGNHRPSAYFAADYCSSPIASLEQVQLHPPTQLMPGITLESL